MPTVYESGMPEEELRNILSVSLIEDVDETALAGCSGEQSATQSSTESDADTENTEDDSDEEEIQMLRREHANSIEGSTRQRQMKALLAKLESDRKCRSVSPEPCEMAAWPNAAECSWNWALSSNRTRVNSSQILTNHFRRTWKEKSRRPLKRGKHATRHKSGTRMKRKQSRCTRIDGCLTWIGRCRSTVSAWMWMSNADLFMI